jgi:hypothetical protein
MAEIPTVEELLIEEIKKFSSPLTGEGLQLLVCNVAIEFAKLHVEQALKEASEKAYVEYINLETKEIFDYTDVITDDGVGANVNKKSILNSYTLENIK